MQRFILQQNVARFQTLLKREASENKRRTLRGLLVVAERELAQLDAALSGVQTAVALFGRGGRLCSGGSADRGFRRHIEASSRPSLVLDPRPGLHILDINDAYAQATMTARAAVAGQKMFDVFPDNPDDLSADGVNNLYNSLRIAAQSGQPHAMPVQRYDVRGPDGRFVERYWRPLNTPVFDGDGCLVYLLHQVDDVTSAIRSEVQSLSSPPVHIPDISAARRR